MAAVALCVAGCAHRTSDVYAPTVGSVRGALDTAWVSGKKASDSTAQARCSLKKAVASAEILDAVAGPAKAGDIADLKSALHEAQTAVETTATNLDAANAGMSDAAARTEVLQSEINGLATELSQAKEAKTAAENSADYWRGTAWKLALLSLALGLWTFRKPLTALAGVAS